MPRLQDCRLRRSVSWTKIGKFTPDELKEYEKSLNNMSDYYNIIDCAVKEETEKARAEGKSMTPEEMKQKVIEEMKRKGMKIVGNSTPA